MSTEWTKAISLYVNPDAYGRDCLLASATASGPLLTPPAFVEADQLTLRLFFRRPGDLGGTSEPLSLEDGVTISVTARARALGESDLLLVLDDDFAETGEAEELHYAGALDLNTAPLRAALAVSDRLEVRFDIELRAAAGKLATLFFDAVLRRRVFDGDPPPDPGEELYPPPGQIVTKLLGSVAIDEGASIVAVSGLDLASVPRTVLLTLRAPSAASPLIVCQIDGSSITADGFTAVLSAQTPAEDYALDYLVIL